MLWQLKVGAMCTGLSDTTVPRNNESSWDWYAVGDKMDTKADLSMSWDRPLLSGTGLMPLSRETSWVKYSKGAELTGLLPEEVNNDGGDPLSIGLSPLSSVLYRSRIDGPSSTKLIVW